MKEQIYQVKEIGSLVFVADLERPPKGNVKTALIKWMEVSTSWLNRLTGGTKGEVVRRG